jgi:hypothetical protein
LELIESTFGRDFTLPSTLTKVRFHKLHGPLHDRQLLPRLQELQYTSCLQGPEYLEGLLCSEKSLEDLNKPFVDDPAFSRLTTLRVCGSRWSITTARDIFSPMSDFDSIFVHPRLFKVETLSIQSHQLHDDGLEKIAKNFNKLRSVRFADAKITGAGIKVLVLGQTQLQWLVLENCASISSDAITWAKDQGVKVKDHYNTTVESGTRLSSFVY